MSEHNNAAYNWGSVSGGCGERDSGCQNTTMQPTTGGVCQVDVERETVGVRTQQCSLQLGECVRWMWRERQWVSDHNNAAYNWGCVRCMWRERQWVSEHNNAATTGGVCQVDVERETVGVRTQQCSLQLGECVRWMWREKDSRCQNTTMQPTTGGVCQVDVERETVGVRTQQCSHNWGSVSGGCGERQWVSEHNNAAYNWGSVLGGCGERDSGCQTTTMQPTTGGVSGVCGERDSGCQNTTMQPQLGECVRWMWKGRQWVSEHNNAAYNWGSVSGGCGERDSGCQTTTMQPTTGGVSGVCGERDSGCQNTTMQPQLGECVRWMWKGRQWVSEHNNAAYNWGSVSGGCGERKTVGVRTQQCSLQLGECVRWMWRERQWVSEHNNAAYNWGSVSGGCGERDSGCQNTTMQPTTGGVCQVDVERETVGVRPQQCSLQLGVCQVYVERETVGVRTQQCSHNWGSVSGGCGKGDSGCQNTTMQPTTGGVCQVDVERERQ